MKLIRSGLIGIFFISVALSLFGVNLGGLIFNLNQVSRAAISPTLVPGSQVLPSPFPSLTPTPVPPTSTPLPLPTSTPPPTPRPTVPPPVVLNAPSGPGLTRGQAATPMGNFSVSVLTVSLNSAKMITDTGNDANCTTDCQALSLSDFVSRNSGFAGVNGTYFCPATYPECAGKTNSYDFPVYNTRLNRWINQDKLFWGERRAMIYVDGSGAHYLHSANSFSGSLTAGIVNYPGLVNGGGVAIDDNQSGLSDKQKAKGTKVGLGIKDSQTVMVVVASNVNMREFAEVFKSLGATGALNLDTGGSTALISGGKYAFGPGRALPNAVIFAAK